jgi:hypothetical protein
MLWLTIASVILAGGALYYAQRQTAIANALKAHQDEQEREVHDWQLKHEAVATKLARVGPHMMVPMPNANSITAVYPTVFTDPQFRQRVETYIIEYAENRTRFIPRRPTELELRSPALRETVTKATEILDRCQQDNPGFYRYFQE